MMKEFMNGLTLNAALLLIICVIFITLYMRYWKRKSIFSFVLGIIIGLVGIALLYSTVDVRPGVVLDTRSILISTAGMFFGFIPTVIGTVIICVYRAFLGGPGVYAGIFITVSSAAVGLLWRKLRWVKIQTNKKKWLEFYLFGLVTHTAMLVCVLALPFDMIVPAYKAIGLPVMIAFPVVSVMVCMVIYDMIARIDLKEELEESDLYLRTVIEQAPLGISIANSTKTILINSKFEKIVGRSRSEIEKLSWEDYTHPDDIEEDKKQFARLLSGEIDSYSMDKRYLKPDGSVVWAHLVIATFRIYGRNQGQYLCMAQEITDTVMAREDLQRSEAKYKALYQEYEAKQALLVCLLNSIPDMIFYKDKNSRYLGCNRAFENYTGLKEADIVGKSVYNLFEKQMADWYRESDMGAVQTKEPQKLEEHVITPDGSIVFFDTVKTPYCDTNGNILGMVGISRDINERKRKEKEIQYLSFHDALTGLYNRAFFEREKIRLDTPAGMPLSVITGDINGLKLINDAFGHDEGDRILQAVANIIKSCARESDIAARIGGDEFSLLLPNTGETAAKEMMEQIKNACDNQSMQIPTELSFASLSLGCATKHHGNELLEKIMKTAEQLMYQRKLLAHKSLHSTIITSIKTALMEKDYETREHCDRLADLSRQLGKQLGLKEEDLIALELLSELHDIGKISVDTNILTKTGALTSEEWAEIKKHPEAGYRIAKTVPELSQIAEYILAHHERWDGKGYPQGLKGESIPLLSRIIAVVDSFDAMTNDRAYRKAKSVSEATLEIEREAGKQFDPVIAQVFVEKVIYSIQGSDDLSMRVRGQSTPPAGNTPVSPAPGDPRIGR